jgi:hypothetical protein
VDKPRRRLIQSGAHLGVNEPADVPQTGRKPGTETTMKRMTHRRIKGRLDSAPRLHDSDGGTYVFFRGKLIPLAVRRAPEDSRISRKSGK